MQDMIIFCYISSLYLVLSCLLSSVDRKIFGILCSIETLMQISFWSLYLPRTPGLLD